MTLKVWRNGDSRPAVRRAALVLSIAVALGVPRVSRADTSVVQPVAEDMVRNLELRTIPNARDLGGLRGSRGFIPHGRFYRSATLVDANEADRRVLLGRGVTLDIDLRTFFEAADAPDRLARDARFVYRRISLVGVTDWLRTGGLAGLYVHVLGEHHESLRDVFRLMARHESGAILFHCASGKDRTGVVSALLLDLAGVSRDAIVRDYAISAHYLHRGVASSPPSAISAFLDSLHARYGSTRAFLAQIGLSGADIQSLLVKLGQA